MLHASADHFIGLRGPDSAGCAKPSLSAPDWLPFYGAWYRRTTRPGIARQPGAFTAARLSTVILKRCPRFSTPNPSPSNSAPRPCSATSRLTVEDGDRIGLIGPNGAGKSTLLALLAGQVEPDSGELAVRKRARAAYVPQDSRFAAGLTVRQVLENGSCGASRSRCRAGRRGREGRLRELAGRAGFADLNAEAASLSGGWRKRLAIVEALVGEPDVLLLDEPTNHLDLAGIEWLEELLGNRLFRRRHR